jgi:hypothetical protein
VGEDTHVLRDVGFLVICASCFGSFGYKF